MFGWNDKNAKEKEKSPAEWFSDLRWHQAEQSKN